MSSDRQSSEKKHDQNQQDHDQHHQQQQQQQKDNLNSEKINVNYKESATELTAEWSVHAQLTISRPNLDNTNNPTATSGANKLDGSGGGDELRKPLKFVYKWSSDDIKPNQTATTTTTTTASDGAEGGTGQYTTTRGVYRSDDTKSEPSRKTKHESFHSNLGSGKPASDSGFSSSFYNLRGTSSSKGSVGGTRCRSTCSIVLSAVADFLPVSSDIPEEIDPFTCTATSYTVSPDKAGDDINASQNFGGMKILALRDAFSQTSDNETRNFTETYHSYPQYQTNNNGDGSKINEEKDGKRRKLYDYRRNTTSAESFQQLQQQQQQLYSSLPVDQTEEGISKSPFYVTPGQQQQPYKSSSQSSITQPRTSPAPSASMQKGSDLLSKKSPRTVHIDVYCTGSDAEDDDDDRDGDKSSSPSSENPNELESNSTPQTVLDIEQILLRHHRAGKHEIPRRLKLQKQHQFPLQQQQQQLPQYLPPSTTSIRDIGHAITKSNTADEISESKQMLFKKHIGDQKNSKFNLRNRLNVRKDPSDDCLSSNYPNSSRSTMRDLTCSSISSVVASNVCEDFESSWKETDAADGTATSLGKSDSFEYDNSIDRLRIKKMEKLWSRPEKEHYVGQEEYKSNTNLSGSPTKQLFSSQRHNVQDFLQSMRLPHITAGQQFEPITLTDYNPHYFDTSQYLEYPPIIPERDESSIEMDMTMMTPTVYAPQAVTQQKFLAVQPPPPTIASVTGRVLHPGHGESGSYFRHSSSEPRSPERIPTKTLYQAEYNKSGSEASTLQSNLSGYTSEYLAKARKFGTVVTALKKPGHHIGPAKNPECQCEHCRRWVAERSEGGRNRAFSMSDAFNIKQSFWLRKAEKFN